MKCSLLFVILLALCLPSCDGFAVPPPPISPATKLPNNIYEWRSQQIRYQMAGDPASPHAVVLVHGLFVNSDHWRFTLKGLAEAGYRAYAIDLLGSGYSSKPSATSDAAKELNGENGRFFEDDSSNGEIARAKNIAMSSSVLKDVELGTASGGTRLSNVDLRHPLGSPYNFYTWGEQIVDFTREVVCRGDTDQATLVCNSIGTISTLQAVLDCSELYNGVFSIAPNFRELHSGEVPLPKLTMPVVQSLQSILRKNGQGLFDALAKPGTVKEILKEPYAVTSAVDDELVDVLLTPLLTPGASDVVFDTLSYSAGPLPEQQLADPSFPQSVPVWVTYGTADPWTPSARVEKLINIQSVKKIVAFDGVGHCPHDEAPETVNPILLEFLEKVKNSKS